MEYEQKDACEIWTIKHNNITNPHIECWVDTEDIRTKILPLHVVTSKNEVQITFSRPYSGIAFLQKTKTWNF